MRLFLKTILSIIFYEDLELQLKAIQEPLHPTAVAHFTGRQPSASTNRGRGRNSKRNGNYSSHGRAASPPKDLTCYNCKGRGHT
ncbi:hypothetical protein Gotur_027636, partial [Gossypium turneri]